MNERALIETQLGLQPGTLQSADGLAALSQRLNGHTLATEPALNGSGSTSDRHKIECQLGLPSGTLQSADGLTALSRLVTLRQASPAAPAAPVLRAVAAPAPLTALTRGDHGGNVRTAIVRGLPLPNGAVW